MPDRDPELPLPPRPDPPRSAALARHGVGAPLRAREPARVTPAPASGLLWAAWLAALGATLGSLFFGEVMGLPPCTLCWYQRICMFPLALLLPIGIVLRDGRVAWYGLPLALIGLGIAVYHNLLDYGVIPERRSPCTEGVSCTSRPIEWFGVVTIPALALVAFAVIAGCLGTYVARGRSAGRARPGRIEG